jgi:translation initiation factor IF-2
MNLTTLAKKLDMEVPELFQKITGYGFRLRKNTKKISDRKAKEIIKKIERERKTIEKTEEEAKKIPQKITLPKIITVKEFSERLNLPVTKVISELMKNGIMATINEEIDFETAAIITEDFGIEAEKEKEEKDLLKKTGVRKKIIEELSRTEKSKLKPRPPVVCVMGHVDHGKTKLLDAIRETNVMEGEAGGITQHIGAYQVKAKGKPITFLDTPGHEAFKAMRERGAKITDIVVLVVAADDGVQPQTIEAIKHAKNADIPIIVAINKIDKEEADPGRVKKELADQGVLTEEWGGNTICVEISAKYKKNLEKLLETILLVAEMEELKTNPEIKALGTVIESHVDPKKGPLATVLVQGGTLKLFDSVTASNIFGVVKAMENFQGKKIDHAKPSTPVKILGLEAVPEVGDILQVEESRERAKEKISKLKKIIHSPKIKKEKEGKIKKLNVILVADVQGSLEALISALSKIKSEEVKVQIINFKVGKITESDIMMAASSNARILGFNAEITSVAKRLAEDRKVEYKNYDIIYRMLDDVKKKLEEMLEPKKIAVRLGKLQILAIFRQEKGKMIVGGKVLSGKITPKASLKIIRDEKIIGEGKVLNLQFNKADVDEVTQGKECGLSVSTQTKPKEGDVLEAWHEEVVKKKIE